GANGTDQGFDLALDVHLADGVGQQRWDRHPLQGHGGQRQENAAQVEPMADQQRQHAQQYALDGYRLDDGPQPADGEDVKVQCQGEDQERVDYLGHRFTSPRG